MKRIVLILFSGLFFLHSAVAQKMKPRFSSTTSIGFVAGQSSPDLILETVNGIKLSDWFAGVGIGVDHYRYKTLPLFMDGRWFFGDDKNGFIYGDIGYNFPMKDKPGKEIYYYDSYHFTGGIYTNIGLGFQVPLYQKSAMSFSLGYSYKKTGTKIGVNICPLAGPCYVDYSQYDYGFGRVMVKAGVAF